MTYLVRTLAGTVHRNTCRHAAKGQRWVWADRNPTENWMVTAPWLKACAVCNPPSPFKP